MKGLRWGLLVSLIVTTGCKGKRTPAPRKSPPVETPAPAPDPAPEPAPDPAPEPASPSIEINAGAEFTSSVTVAVALAAESAVEMYITNTAGCITGGHWKPFAASSTWVLSRPNATNLVYAKVRTADAMESPCVSDAIVHDIVAPTWTDVPVFASSYNSATTTPVIAWSANATDAVSGVGAYQYALGTGSAEASQTSLVSWTEVSNGSFAHTGLTLAHGSNYYVTMRVLDRAGNVTTRPSSSWNVDLVAPVLTMSAPATESVITDPDVAFVGTCEGSLALQFSYGVGLSGPASANCNNGTYSVVAQNDPSSGVRGVTIVERDAAGNTTAVGRSFQYAQSLETNGQVLAMVVDGDGVRYVGGNFTHVATSREPYFVKLTAAGAKSSDFRLGSGFNGQVKAAASLSDGSLIVVGEFTRYRGQVANRVAKIDATGILDTTFSPQTGANGANATVNAVAVWGTSVFIGGAFTQYRGTAANYVTRLDLTGAKDATFSPTSGANGVNGVVYALATDGTSLFVGGAFTQYRGATASRLAEVSLAGALDTTFNPASGANGANDIVNALATDGTSLFVGGAFTQIRGATANRLAKVDLAGVLDTTFNPALGPNGTNNTVNALSIDGQALYAGGAFTQYRGSAANYLLKVDLDGAKDTIFNPNLGANGVNNWVNSVYASDGAVYAGGAFTLYRNGVALRLVKVSSAGALDTTFSPAEGANGADNLVYTIVGHADGIYAGGAFGHYRPAHAVNYVARIKTDGTLDTNFSPKEGTGGTNNVVRALALQGSALYIGGDFTLYRATAANRLVKVDKTSGAKDATFSPNSGANGVNSSVYALAADDSYVYLGGTFTQYRGSKANYLTKIDGSGEQEKAFGRANGTNSAVYALLLDDDALYLGGAFTQYRSSAANRVTKVDKTSGDKDTTFSPNSGANGTNSIVYALAASGSQLYLGGAFTSYRGTAANYVTKVDLSTGVKDTTFSPDSGSNGASTQVSSLAVSGTSVYIGGTFTQYRGATANYVARVSDTGTLDSTFSPVADFNGTNGSVDVIVPVGAKIWLGGAFTLYRNGGAFYSVPVTSSGVVSP